MLYILIKNNLNMFDNKLNNSQKCNRNSNTIESSCIKKCIKWNLVLKADVNSSNIYGEYKTYCDSSKMASNISHLFPLDLSRPIRNSRDTTKFSLEFMYGKNLFPLSGIVGFFINVRFFNLGICS